MLMRREMATRVGLHARCGGWKRAEEKGGGQDGCHEIGTHASASNENRITLNLPNL